MGVTEKINMALDMYRLCKVEPKWFKAWIHHKNSDTDKDFYRKDLIPESQFGFTLAIMRRPTSDLEVVCITEFLDEKYNHIPGTPKVEFVEYDDGGATHFDPATFKRTENDASWVGESFIHIHTRSDGYLTTGFGGPVFPTVVDLVNELGNRGIPPENIIINMD